MLGFSNDFICFVNNVNVLFKPTKITTAGHTVSSACCGYGETDDISALNWSKVQGINEEVGPGPSKQGTLRLRLCTDLFLVPVEEGLVLCQREHVPHDSSKRPHVTLLREETPLEHFQSSPGGEQGLQLEWNIRVRKIILKRNIYSQC